MLPKNFSEVYHENFLAHWDALSRIRTPVIAAVNGFAVSRKIIMMITIMMIIMIIIMIIIIVII